MPPKRKRSDVDQENDDSASATDEPSLKRTKTSTLPRTVNADALACIMQYADFASAVNLAATCQAGQEAINQTNSPFWYAQAKVMLPGLTGT
jgi:negative regulator of genetic competence, sporulation and motility